MGVIIPEGFGQVGLSFSVSGSLTEKIMTLGVKPIGAMDLDPAAIAEAVSDAMVGTDRPVRAAGMFDEWTYNGVYCTVQTVTGPLSSFFGDTVVGTATGESVPTNCGIIITKQTSLGGRKNRGRMYWPPTSLASANVAASGTINPSQVADYVTRWSNMDLAMVGNDVQPFLLHSDATAPSQINGFGVESTLGTQRRRMR